MLFTEKDAIQPQQQASAHILCGYLWLWVHIFILLLKCNVHYIDVEVEWYLNKYFYWLLLYSFAMVLISYTLPWPPSYPITSLKFQ